MNHQGKQLEIFDLLKVNLTAFEGPLDLLLELIRKHKMDIRDISLAEICAPYLEYIEFMEEFDMDVAIEFLDIASTLILIKSKSLLPRPELEDIEDDGLDTEEELRRKLIEYQRYKYISEYFDKRDILGRDTFTRPQLLEEDKTDVITEFADLSVYNLLMAYKRSQRKKSYRKPHTISKPEFPIERKIIEFLPLFKSGQTQLFRHLVAYDADRSEIVVSFMAVLELSKLFLMKLHQMQEFGPIHCKPIENIEEYIPKFENQFKNVS